MKVVRIVLSLFFIVILSVVFAGTDKASAAAKLKTILGADPINLDPPALATWQDNLIDSQIFQGLVTYDYASKPPHPIIPEVAKSYEISKDGRTITFKLNPGIQFHHDYGELTSEDVVFSIQRHFDKKVTSLSKSQLVDLDRVEALDKYTVKFSLKRPVAFQFMQNLAYLNTGFLVSKKACTKLGDKAQRTPVGTGPYYFDQWLPGEKVVLKKFSNYWKTPAKIDEIEFWVMPEETVALGALEKGELDIVPLIQLGSYERAVEIKNKEISIAEASGDAKMFVFYINHQTKPMDDLRVRKALAHALDLKGIVARMGQQVRYWPSAMSPATFAATTEFWKYDYDLEKAKKLLAEAGYPKGFELELIYKKGGLYEPITLEVANCWKKVVDVKVKLVPDTIFGKVLKQEGKQHVGHWGMTCYDPSLWADFYVTGSSRQASHYSNPKLDEVISRALQALDEKEAQKYWREFQRMVTEDVVNYWVCAGTSLIAKKNKVKGVVVTPQPGVIMLEKAYIE